MPNGRVSFIVLFLFAAFCILFIPEIREAIFPGYQVSSPSPSRHERHLTGSMAPDNVNNFDIAKSMDYPYLGFDSNDSYHNYYYYSRRNSTNRILTSNDISPGDALWCKTAHKDHSVQLGKSWGTLTIADQKRWEAVQCGKFLKSEGAELVPKSEQLFRCKEYVRRVSLPSGFEALSENEKLEFRSFHCIILVIEDNVMRFTPPVCSAKDQSSTLAYNPSRSKSSQHFSFDHQPVIAIMSGSTTRKVENPSLTNIALFRILLPSLSITLECGYSYMIVIGYDVGDVYFDTEKGIREIEEWFQLHFVSKYKDSGITTKLVFVRVNNTLKKPGPVFNEMARKSYELGADFFFRVNDDTEIIGKWPNLFVSALRYDVDPVMVGVVGPYCNQGNRKILTHDFTSRLHMEIFGMNYYPPELIDWWLDDWVSMVYGSRRTFISSAETSYVIHHVAFHGTSYNVDRSREGMLGGLVQRGKSMVKAWMMGHLHDGSEPKKKDQISDFKDVQVAADKLREYDTDRFDGKPFRDVTVK